MQSLDAFAQEKLRSLETRDLRRRLSETDRLAPPLAWRGGRQLISFCCNDYLGLSHHPTVKRAAAAALDAFGAGAGASRLVTGNHTLYAGLEARLAALKGSEAACVFGSGYLANLGIVPALVGPGDLILADELSHACLLAGGSLSGARLIRFRHNALDHVAELLDRERGAHRHCLILTDGVFSMDGDLAPLPALAALAHHHDGWLMSDDAHGIGVVGGGRGSSFAFGEKVEVPLQMGTLSKAVGGYGGYLCASQPVIDLIRTRARTLIYSTGLPPASVAAAAAALDLIASDPGLCARPLAKARLFAAALGLEAPQSCIVPLILGDPLRTLAASEQLAEAGFLVTAIRPPTVPAGTARLRFTFCAGHEDADIIRLAEIVRTCVLGGRAPAALPAGGAM
jgi:8-amino-7-oxononanoate synthase